MSDKPKKGTCFECGKKTIVSPALWRGMHVVYVCKKCFKSTKR